MAERMKRVKKIGPTRDQFLRIRSRVLWKQIWGHIGFGLRSGIPLCCCLEWVTRLFLLNEKNFGVKLCGPDCYSEFVHCTLHRRYYRAEHKRAHTGTVWFPEGGTYKIDKNGDII